MKIEQKIVKLPMMMIVVGSFVTGANASIVSGDFRTEGDLPDFSAAGPLVYEAIGVTVGAGPELTEVDLLANPASWIPGLVYMDLDPVTNILTLDSQDQLDFQTFEASISNIVLSPGETITGVSLISDNLTDEPGVSLVTAFTGNSVTINYEFGVGTSEVFNFTGDQSTFQISTSAIPEVTSSGLLAGLLVLSSFSRRRR